MTTAATTQTIRGGELHRAKASLVERTNLLREMLKQTTAYQADANRLDEAVMSYKQQLAKSRDIAQHLERDIHDKNTMLLPNRKEHAMVTSNHNNGGNSDAYYATDENDRPNIGRLEGPAPSRSQL